MSEIHLGKVTHRRLYVYVLSSDILLLLKEAGFLIEKWSTFSFAPHVMIILSCKIIQKAHMDYRDKVQISVLFFESIINVENQLTNYCSITLTLTI